MTVLAPSVLLPLLVACAGLFVFLWAWGRGPWLPHPGILFVPMQMAIILGTAALVDPANAVHIQYVWILSGSTVLYLMGLLVARKFWPTPRSQRLVWRDVPLATAVRGSLEDKVMFTVIGVSIIVSALYYVAIGYNLFLETIWSFLSGGSVADIETRRLATYSGSEYFAPGYVNQFKNILLPALTSVVVVRYALTRNRAHLWGGLLLVVISIVGLLGTGQRGAFVIATAAAAIFAVVALPRTMTRKALAICFVGGLLFMFVATIALGRSADGSEDTSALENAAKGIWYRIFRENQISGLAYHQHYADGAPVWGGEWAHRLHNLLPGAGEKTTDNEIHAVLYGSDRGTAPATLWGSVWHNFALPGAILVPLILAATHQALYARILAGPKSDVRLAVFVGVSTTLGFWIAGGPDGLVEGGVVTLAILHLLVYRFSREVRRRFGHRGRAIGYDTATPVDPGDPHALETPEPGAAGESPDPQRT